jgi:hypothetical protein
MRIFIKVVAVLSLFCISGYSAADGILLYSVSPMERIIDNRPVPESEAIKKSADSRIRIFAAPGQYIPATFVVYPACGRKNK